MWKLRFFSLLVFLTMGLAYAQQAYVYSPRAEVLYVRGDVTVVRDGRAQGALPNQILKEGDTLKTGKSGYAVLRLADGQKLSVEPRHELTLWVFFHSSHSGTWVEAAVQKVKAPFVLLWRVKTHGADFEDETSNTLACVKG